MLFLRKLGEFGGLNESGGSLYVIASWVKTIGGGIATAASAAAPAPSPGALKERSWANFPRNKRLEKEDDNDSDDDGCGGCDCGGGGKVPVAGSCEALLVFRDEGDRVPALSVPSTPYMYQRK